MKVCQNCGTRNDDSNNYCDKCTLPFLRVLRPSPSVSLVLKLHPFKIRYVVFAVIAIMILLAAVVAISSIIGSQVDLTKHNPNEIVDSAHNINVGYLQNLAAKGLSSIRAANGLPDESVIDIRYDVETDGTCFIEITGTGLNGNVAYFVEGKPSISEPEAIGEYTGQVVVIVSNASIAHGSLSIDYIVKLSHNS